MKQVRLALIHDYLQATALRARLYENGVEAHITEQLNTGSTAGEPALRLGGVSAISPGHPIYVHAEQIDEARRVLDEFAKEHGTYVYKSNEALNEEETADLLRDYRQKVLLLSVVGGFMIGPFILPFALYYLWRYYREGGNWFSPAIIAGLCILLPISAAWIYGVFY